MQQTQRIFRAGAPGLKVELRDIVPPENGISAWIDRPRGAPQASDVILV
jgi:hypothetical protein